MVSEITITAGNEGLFTSHRGLALHLAVSLRSVLWLLPTLVASILIAYIIRFDGIPAADVRAELFTVVPVIALTKILALLAMRLPLSCHAFVSLHDAYRLLKTICVATVAVVAVDSMILTPIAIPRGVIVIDACLTTLIVGGILSLRRLRRERRENPSRTAGGGKRVLVVAGPASAELMLRAIRSSRIDSMQIVGLLTDAERLQHKAISGIPVVGTLAEIDRLAKVHGAQTILLSGGDLPGSEVRRIMNIGERHGIEVRVVPDVSQIVCGHIHFKPREVAIEDLLGRPTVDIDQSELNQWIVGKRLLVSGSCGSIGSELVRQLLKFSPEKIVLVDRSENGQFHLGRELHQEVRDGTAEILIADVNDLSRMNSIFREHQPHIVFHAAAYKHVPLMEQHPGEGVKNIIGATKVIADLSHACGVETFVMISTDKAVNPTSVMGCCKRVAELYVQSMSDKSVCRFVTVRFGNVLGSAGSVIPVFREQIEAGGPLTVTHPDMTRYFMTIPEASQLVIQAAAMGHGGEIFVLDMGSPIKIMDLARDMIKLSGLRLNRDIEIEITGLRPGEKLYEELYATEELQVATSHAKILKARCVAVPHAEISSELGSILKASNGSKKSVLAVLKNAVPSYLPDHIKSANRRSFTASESGADTNEAAVTTIPMTDRFAA